MRTENLPVLQQADEQRRLKRYAEAIKIYADVWQAAPMAFNAYHGWSYAYSLQQTKQYGASLDVCRQLYPLHGHYAPLKQCYAWNIYFTVFKENYPGEINDAEASRALTAVWELCPPGQPFSPAHRCLFARVKQLARRKEIPWEEIWQLLNLTQPALLCKDPYVLPSAGNKQKTLASDLEEWYSWCSKALLHTGRWEACVNLCSEALQNITLWHYSNNIWFLRRKAAALHKMGKTEEALIIMDSLVAQKKDWYLLADRAAATADAAEALAWYARASLKPSEPHMKVGMWEQMAHLLLQMGNTEAAWQHLQLCNSVRFQQGWPLLPLPRPLQEIPLPEVSENEKPQVWIKKITPFWQQHLLPQWQKQQGVIHTVMPGNQSGFIRSHGSSNTVYFRMKEVLHKNKPIEPGTPVSYYLEETLHPKNQTITVHAVQIEIITGSGNGKKPNDRS